MSKAQTPASTTSAASASKQAPAQKQTPLGLPNFGSTCYLNSSLQGLASTCAVRQCFAHFDSEWLDEGYCSTKPMRNRLVGLKMEFAHRYPDFSSDTTEQDSHEFLRYFLDMLSQNVDKRVNEARKEGVRAVCGSVIDGLFRCTLLTVRHCASCDAFSTKLEHVLDLCLALDREPAAQRPKGAAPLSKHKLKKRSKERRKAKKKRQADGADVSSDEEADCHDDVLFAVNEEGATDAAKGNSSVDSAIVVSGEDSDNQSGGSAALPPGANEPVSKFHDVFSWTASADAVTEVDATDEERTEALIRRLISEEEADDNRYGALWDDPAPLGTVSVSISSESLVSKNLSGGGNSISCNVSHSNGSLDGDVTCTADAEWVGTEAEGVGTEAGGVGAEAGGVGTEAGGVGTEAEGVGTKTEGVGTEAEGIGTETEGIGTEAEGVGTQAEGVGTEVEGVGTEAGRVGTVVPHQRHQRLPNVSSRCAQR